MGNAAEKSKVNLIVQNQKSKQMRYFLKLWPTILICAIWFVFAHPYFLYNKAPFPATYQVNNFAPWSANSQFWGPVKNSAMPDIITQIYPWRHLVIEIWKSGQVPLWNPYTFSGNPLLANYQSATLSPFNLLFFALPFVDAWIILVILQPLLAGLFMYLFARSLKINQTGATISSVSFMFCGFLTSWMGYATLGYAILFLPFSLFCIEKYYSTKKIIFLVSLSLTIPLSFFSGHFQISLYFLMTIIAYTIYKFIITRKVSDVLRVAFFAFFGVLFTMPQVLPSAELYLESFRSSFFQSGGIPITYLPTLVAPDFFGNPVTRNTWFGHYAEWNMYIGVLPIILAIYSLSRIRKHQITFLLIFGCTALLLAIDNPFSNFFLNLHIPIFSTSSINRIIVLFSFTFSVLAGFGYDFLLLDIKNSSRKVLLLFGLFGLLFVILWAAITLHLLIPIDKVMISRQNLLLPTFIFLASCIAIAAVILLNSTKYRKVTRFIIAAVFIAITSFDMLRFTTKWQPFDPKNLVFPDFSTTKAFSKISGFNRVFGNLGGEATIYYRLPSVEGYDALYSKRYGQFVAYIESRKLIQSAWSVVMFPKHSQDTLRAINFMDIKYIVHKLADSGASWTLPIWTYPGDQLKLIYKDSFYEFYENAKVFPHAFLVGKYRVGKNSDEILNLMFDKDFDLRNEIVLEEDPKIRSTKGYVGDVVITSYRENSMEISVDTKSKSLLFLADNYNQGWKATVDGKSIPILRANYTFRAIPVDAGKHSIKLSYDPWSFKFGIYLAVGGLAGTMLTALFSRKANPSRPSSS